MKPAAPKISAGARAIMALRKNTHGKLTDTEAATPRPGKSEIARKVQPAGRVQAPRHDTPRGRSAKGK